MSQESLTQREFAGWSQTAEARAAPGKHELIDGFVVWEPPAAWPHGEIEVEICASVREFVKRHKLGRVFGPSQGFELPQGETVGPDCSFVSHERWSAARRRADEFLRVVPDLAVEIVSPGTVRRDKIDKKRVYARNGVREYWIVEPRARTVTLYVRAAKAKSFGRGKVIGERGTLRSVVLPGFELGIGDLFPMR